MEINIAESSGFCFGVKRAIRISRELAETHQGPIYVLGDLVHNTFVVSDLSRKGIRKIDRICPGKGGTLIIRAHGAPQETFKNAERCGFSIKDLTCPKVKDIYSIGRDLEEKGNSIIIIGDREHDEVKGIKGQLRTDAKVIGHPADIEPKELSGMKRTAVITQSTQSIDNIQRIMKQLRKIIPGISLHNTTCRTTRIKQQEIRSMPLKNDVILIIGSSTSANTKRLYQIASSLNKRTWWIESARDIVPGWIDKDDRVGIMAGASTPDRITEEVVIELKKLDKAA